VEQAREAFRVGSALAKEGQWVDALAQFERSARLRPHAVTTYDIAFCERALGRYTRARRSFGRSLSAPPGEMPAPLAAEARGYLAEIESRLARAVTTLSPEGAAVAVDGRPLEVASADAVHVELVAGTRDPGPAEPVSARSFHLVLDPGTHIIVVRAPGAPEAVVTLAFSAGATVPLALGAVMPPPPQVVATPPRRRGAVAAFSVGALGLAISAIFGGLALRRRSELEGVCVLTCPHTEQPSVDAMNVFAGASTAGAVVAGAGAALGTFLWVTVAPGAPGAATLSVGPSGLGIRASF
jgi:hypothetical protein